MCFPDEPSNPDLAALVDVPRKFWWGGRKKVGVLFLVGRGEGKKEEILIRRAIR